LSRFAVPPGTRCGALRTRFAELRRACALFYTKASSTESIRALAPANLCGLASIWASV
jgi:hypothetical protein